MISSVMCSVASLFRFGKKLRRTPSSVSRTSISSAGKLPRLSVSRSRSSNSNLRCRGSSSRTENRRIPSLRTRRRSWSGAWSGRRRLCSFPLRVLDSEFQSQRVSSASCSSAFSRRGFRDGSAEARRRRQKSVSGQVRNLKRSADCRDGMGWMDEMDGGIQRYGNITRKHFFFFDFFFDFFFLT